MLFDTLWPLMVITWAAVLEEPEPWLVLLADLGDTNTTSPNSTTPPPILLIVTGPKIAGMLIHPLLFNRLIQLMLSVGRWFWNSPGLTEKKANQLGLFSHCTSLNTVPVTK